MHFHTLENRLKSFLFDIHWAKPGDLDEEVSAKVLLNNIYFVGCFNWFINLFFTHFLKSTVAIAQQKKLNPITTVASHTGGKIVFAGKIQDVTRSVTEGFAQGKVTIKGMKGSGEMENQVLMIHFKNEYLVAIKQSIIQEADKVGTTKKWERWKSFL